MPIPAFCVILCHVTSRVPHPVLKLRRNAKGLTQDELAKKTKIDRSRVSGLETGRITTGPSPARKLARVRGGEPADYIWSAKKPIDMAEELVKRLGEGGAVPDDLRREVAAQMEATATLCTALAARLREGLAAEHSAP